MNRAEKTKEYLREKRDYFARLNQLKIKSAFFDAVKDFRQNVVPSLRRLSIVEPEKLSELDDALVDVETHRSQDGSGIYQGTRVDFDEVLLKLGNLMLSMHTVRIPVHIRIADHVQEVFASAYFTRALVLFLLGAAISLFQYLASID
jgi:hypothetical protein